MPLYELLFDMTVSLCEQFSGYTPTAIRKINAHEMFLMIGRLNRHNQRKKKNRNEKGEPVIRRPASDNWF